MPSGTKVPLATRMDWDKTVSTARGSRLGRGPFPFNPSAFLFGVPELQKRAKWDDYQVSYRRELSMCHARGAHMRRPHRACGCKRFGKELLPQSARSLLQHLSEVECRRLL